MSRRRLLLADDSATIQKVVNLTFTGEGIEVITVGDGDSAIEEFNKVKPDLVMADVTMPGLSGYQICEIIKKNDVTKQIPVILLVGSFEPFDENRARQVGADDFLTKPFQSIRQLVNKVSDLLNRSVVNKVSGLLDENGNDYHYAKIANSFEDTLEIKPAEFPEKTKAAPEDLDDAGMDDQMIQTNRIGNLSVVEPQEFESDYESFAKDINLHSSKQPYQFDSLTEFEYVKDWAQSKDDFEEITPFLIVSDDLSDEKKSRSTGESEFAGEEKEDLSNVDSSAKIESDANSASDFFVQPKKSGVSKLPDAASILEFDEFNLLELFPLEWETVADPATTFARTENSDELMEIVEVSAQPERLSSEAIQAIADKIIEKFSDAIIRKIVKEVIAQTKENE